jgi:tetratricopeptide (TPR) repeat protein
VRRSLAFIAVGVAVAVAAAIVIAGMSSGGEAAGGAAVTDPAGGELPSGHPSISSDETGGEKDEDGARTAGESETGALERLEARRGEDPDDVAVLLDLGEAYFMAQRLGEAEQAYTQALEAEPDSTPAQVGLAMVWHAQGDSRRAEEALHAILEQHPDDQDAHYSLAIVFFSDGQIDAAKDEWQKAAGIDPTSVTGRRSQSFVDLLEDGQSGSPHSSD